jgi:uncharacterized protein DUF481
MRKYLQLLLIFLCGKSLHAQFSDSVQYYAGFTSTGTYNRTNTSGYYLLNNGFKFSARKKAVRLNSTNKWLYGRQDDVLTNNDVSSAWDVNLYKTLPHFNYWGLLIYNSSYSLKVNNQLQAGAGIAYNVVDRKMIVVNLSDGLIYDYSDLNLTDSTREVYGTPRNSFRIQVKWNVKERLIFSGNCFLQHSLQDVNDYIVKSDLSLSVKLKKWLSITSAYSFNKMTRTRTENIFLTYGITIENYF